MTLKWKLSLSIVVVLSVLALPRAVRAVDSDGDGSDSTIDCDDTNAAVYPGKALGAADAGDGVDNDCDDNLECFGDVDDDNFGTNVIVDNTPTSSSCNAAANRAAVSTDCDDTNAAVYPGKALGAADAGDGVDNDCDDNLECFSDVDDDNFGTSVIVDNTPTSSSCNAAANRGPVPTDCDDTNAAVYPGKALGAADVSNGVDNDCDDFEECYQDLDDDNVGSSTIIDDVPLASNCIDATNRAAVSADCNDDNSLCGNDCSLCEADGYRCHGAATQRDADKFVPLDVTLTDGWEARETTIIKPFLFCSPVDRNGSGIISPAVHLVCYKIKDAASDPAQSKFATRDVEVQSELGAEQWTVRKPKIVCLPATKTDLP
jgi:hypothetical protein